MSTLTEFLFPAPAPRQAAAVINWWESRRLAYNSAVGVAGVFTLGAVQLLALLPPYPVAIKLPWQPIVAFAFCANVCYSFGPVLEIMLGKAFAHKLLPVGPTLFRMGLTFSIGLALFPSLVMGFSYAYRILRFLTG